MRGYELLAPRRRSCSDRAQFKLTSLLSSHATLARVSARQVRLDPRAPGRAKPVTASFGSAQLKPQLFEQNIWYSMHKATHPNPFRKFQNLRHHHYHPRVRNAANEPTRRMVADIFAESADMASTPALADAEAWQHSVQPGRRNRWANEAGVYM